MSPSGFLRRGLPLLALAAVLLATPGDARWTEEYGALDGLEGGAAEFKGLACRPTESESSRATSPRADIIGAEGFRSNGESVYIDRVLDYEFVGAANEHRDPRDVEGSPYGFSLFGRGSIDYTRDVSLGKAGWFLGSMQGPVASDGGADVDLYVYEDDGGGPEAGVKESFCVFGGTSAAGPFAFVGLYHAPDDDGSDGVPGTGFDLDAYYAQFLQTNTLTHLIVMDSDTAEPFVDVSFSYEPESPVTSLEDVTFTDETDLSGFTVVRRAWSVDGVEVQDDPASATFVHPFQKPGTREVCLSVVARVVVYGDPVDARGSTCQELEILNQDPVADLSADPPNPAIGQVVQLDARTSADPEDQLDGRFVWDLGDGTKKTAGPLLQHRYDKKGIYTVTVTVADQHGATDTATFPVATENEAPEASFEVRDNTGTRLNDITFDASASTDPDGDRLTYRWDFGDGTPPVEGHGPSFRVVKHAYQGLSPDADTPYVVTLTVRDDFNGEDQATDSILILYEPPVADFDGPTAILSLEEATFTDTSTAGQPEHPLASRTWTLGKAAPLVDGPESVTRAFDRPGDYVITLRVVDSNGGYGVKQQTLTVENRPPVVDATGFALPSATRIPVTWDLDVADLDGEVVSWQWDFGDGTRSSDPAPRHAYARTGSYPLTLTVIDDLGARTTWQPPGGVLHVSNEAPTAQMSVFGDPDNPRSVRFQDASSDDGEVVAWAWYFDDGANDPTKPDSLHPEATHSFPDAEGTYRVRLVVQDDAGVEWTLTRFVRPGALAAGDDTDGDGVLDGIDNCPDEANPDQADGDADGVGDACVDLDGDPDGDSDGDGIRNADDAFPLDPTEHLDTDGDGVGDNADPDDDGDGIPDDEELLLGTDPLAWDTDGDGVGDAAELATGSDPLAAPLPPEPEPEPVQEVVEPEERSLVWVWVLAGIALLAGAATAVGVVLRRRRSEAIQWRKPEF